MKLMLAAGLAALTAACATAAPPPHSAHAAPAAAQTTPLIRTAATVSGQPLKLPQGPAEVVMAAVELAPGGRLPVHRHPWSRYVYVERGRLRVTNLDTGAVRELAAGQVLVEAVDQWHEAQALGSDPLRLIVIDQVPPGVVNMVMREPR